LSQDYYQILGVPRTASQDDIKHAFKKLAAQHHPDRGGSADRFKEVNSAYQVLSDATKKDLYDRFGTEDPTRIPPPQPRRSPFRTNFHVTMDDLNSVFNKHFDPFGPFAGGGIHDFAKKAKPAPVNGEDIRVTVSVPMDEALSGTKRTVRFDRGETRPCRSCASAPKSRAVCPTCSGNGRVVDMVGGTPAVRQCRSCGGSGSVPVNRCNVCSGSGQEPVQREIAVTIPRGLRDGQDMKVKGMGKVGSPPGDLLISVEVRDSAAWWARGENLFTSVEIGLRELVQGGNTTVRLPDGTNVLATIPAGGGQATVRGAWKHPSGKDGDLTVLFRIKSSKDVSPRAERLMKELLEELEGRARQG
jgi:molecular chaperone DnaJ